MTQRSGAPCRSSSTSRLPEATTPTSAVLREPIAALGAARSKRRSSMVRLLPVAKPARRPVQPTRGEHQVLDRAGGEQAAIDVEQIDAEVLRPLDHLPLAQPLD